MDDVVGQLNRQSHSLLRGHMAQQPQLFFFHLWRCIGKHSLIIASLASDGN